MFFLLLKKSNEIFNRHGYLHPLMPVYPQWWTRPRPDIYIRLSIEAEIREKAEEQLTLLCPDASSRIFRLYGNSDPVTKLRMAISVGRRRYFRSAGAN